jgi:uncharacterized protein (DUF1786 family)
MINPFGKEQNKSNREEKLKEIKEELERFKNGKLNEEEIYKLRETIAANVNILDPELIDEILKSGIFEPKGRGDNPYKMRIEGLEILKKQSQKSPEESNDAQS